MGPVDHWEGNGTPPPTCCLLFSETPLEFFLPPPERLRPSPDLVWRVKQVWLGNERMQENKKNKTTVPHRMCGFMQFFLAQMGCFLVVLGGPPPPSHPMPKTSQPPKTIMCIFYSKFFTSECRRFRPNIHKGTCLCLVHSHQQPNCEL